MCIEIPDVRVGQPTRCGALEVFPLFTERLPHGTLEYLLSAEAMAAGTCTVVETGKVSELTVENTGKKPVLFLEGEEVCGGRQNRAVGESVLVGAGTRTTVPVFCVERGRWGGSSPHLMAGSHCPPSLRHVLKRGSSVTGTFRSINSQAAVWRLIAAKHFATGTCSQYENMSDALRPEVVEGLRQTLKYPEGASGIAVTRNGKTIGIDVFDRPDSLQKLWDRLVIMGLTLDAVDLRDADLQADDISRSVQLYMDSIRSMRWQQMESVALGELYRATGDDGSLATALVVDGSLLHVSMSAPI